MSRTDIIDDILDAIAARTALRGSADSPTGTWPEAHGPKVLYWADPKAGAAHPSKIWWGNLTGSIDQVGMTPGGIVTYEDTFSFDLVAQVGAHVFATTASLISTVIDQIIGVFHTDVDDLASRVVLSGSFDGPDYVGSDDGVSAVVAFSVEVTSYPTGL